MKICIRCGELATDSYCEEHQAQVRKEQRPPKTYTRRERGYDHRWDRLSRKARKLQPFCSDCGATEDLQLDHSPETWERVRQRLPIRLEHTGGVVCAACNRARGDARNPGGGWSPRPTEQTGAQGTETITLANGYHLGRGAS